MEINNALSNWDEIGKPLYHKKAIYFPRKNTYLYFKSKNWGLTGDHKVSVISTKSNSEFLPDTISEYVFYGFENIIYKVEGDTLKLYSNQDILKPQKFESEIFIKTITIKNSIEWIDLKKNIQNEYQIFK